MHARNAAFDFVDPRRRIAAAVGDPIGVDFEPDGFVQPINQDLHRRFSIELRQLMTVIVITNL